MRFNNIVTTQELINKVKSKCCGIKEYENFIFTSIY